MHEISRLAEAGASLPPDLSALPRRAAAPLATQQFNAIMQAPGHSAAEPGDMSNAPVGAAPPAGGGRPRQGQETLGDRILRPFSKSGADVSSSWHGLQDRLQRVQRGSMTDPGYMKEILDVQMDWTTTFLNLDLLSKGVGKAAYTVDSLSRN